MNSVSLPKRQRLYSVTERADLAAARVVIITAAVDHNLLELEVVHVLHVDLCRHCRHHYTPPNCSSRSESRFAYTPLRKQPTLIMSESHFSVSTYESFITL